MYERERILDKLAEYEARVMHGSLDLSMEQWATIYDRIEWIYRKTSTEKLAHLVAADDAVASYDDELADDAIGVDRHVAEEKWCVGGAEERSFEVSVA